VGFLVAHAAREDAKVRIQPEDVHRMHDGDVRQNNDDFVVACCLQLESAVLLTNDMVMQIKARAKGVPYVEVSGKTSAALYHEIIGKCKAVTFMDYELAGRASSVEQMKCRAADALHGVVCRVLRSELGDAYVHFVPPGSSPRLEALLQVVLRHYALFRAVLPRSARDIVARVHESLRRGRDVEDELRTLLLLFGLDPGAL
jgi:hypothetical protein